MRVALFDLGRTLVRGDPAVMFAEYLRARDRFPAASWERLEEALRLYHGGGDQDLAVERANDAFASAFSGLDPAVVQAWAQEHVRSGQGGQYYAYTRPLVEAVRRLGCRTAAVTGVADPLASVIGHDLGLSETYATALERDERGLLTGHTVFDNGPGWKLRRIAHLLDSVGDARAECLAFGDSEADLPMLHAVGRPIVLNARGVFREAVAALGWPAFDEGEDIAATLEALMARRPWHTTTQPA